MKNIKLILGLVLTSVVVAITYHIFENAIHGSINFIWYDTFNTNENRYLVIPLAVFFSLVFFGLQHYLDRKSENKEEHGLGNAPDPKVANYLRILLIGFFSLLAGATLGPEAILVPASMVAGAIIGKSLLKDKTSIKLLSAASIMALFTAFFNSFFIGVLSLFLILKQANVKFKPVLLVIAVISSGVSLLTLNFLESDAYADIPVTTWKINLTTVAIGALLAVLGYVSVYVIEFVVKSIKNNIIPKENVNWILKSLVAGTTLGLLYILGGSLVEFTGNKSIEPMLNQASELGYLGLAWIVFIKILLIGWSKSVGYRGGMIFPTIFLAAVFVAMVQLKFTDFNFVYGIIFVIVGALAANKKTHTLV